MLDRKSLAPTPNSLSAILAQGTGGYVPSGVSVSEIRLAPVYPSDDPFLYRTYASTRAEEMALTGWTAEQQESFLRMQYEAQRRSYRMQFPNAEYRVIRRGDSAVGRLVIDRTIDRTPEEILVLDIAVLPEFRAQKIGSTLMQAIMQEASQAAKAVRLHVERFNPALRWYERLGFGVVNDGSIYLEMVWRPSQASGCCNQPASDSEPDVQEPAFGVAYADSSA